MTIEKKSLKREFVLESNGTKTTLPDPDPTMTEDQVLAFYTNTYPELVTSTVCGPVYKDNKMVYSFKTTVGTKG